MCKDVYKYAWCCKKSVKKKKNKNKKDTKDEKQKDEQATRKEEKESEKKKPCGRPKTRAKPLRENFRRKKKQYEKKEKVVHVPPKTRIKPKKAVHTMTRTSDRDTNRETLTLRGENGSRMAKVVAWYGKGPGFKTRKNGSPPELKGHTTPINTSCSAKSEYREVAAATSLLRCVTFITRNMGKRSQKHKPHGLGPNGEPTVSVAERPPTAHPTPLIFWP